MYVYAILWYGYRMDESAHKDRLEQSWLVRVWLPSARDSLRWHRQRVGSRWSVLRVLPHRLLACRSPEPAGSPHGGFGWRCQRLWLHGGAHRFRNYVWHEGAEHAHFDPLPSAGRSQVTW